MKKLRIGTGAITGGLLTAALTSLMYLVHKLVDLPYIPYEFFDWITRVLPGGLVTFGIDLMIDSYAHDKHERRGQREDGGADHSEHPNRRDGRCCCRRVLRRAEDMGLFGPGQWGWCSGPCSACP